ncbi:MAG: DNRLRE domain-containing protein [Myxococcales bacterium]|nr:DNRLRE domain-containing protein [Myxococcales bacterium]
MPLRANPGRTSPLRSWCRIGLLISVLLLVVEQPARAQSSVTYEPDRDNTIYEENENSNGAGPTVTVGRTSGSMGTLSRRALLRFDVTAGLPKGATVDNATLTMVVQRGNPDARDASLYVLTEDWGEGTGSSMGGQGLPATVGDVTWTCRFSDGAAGCMSGDEWAMAGGSFVSTASATASVGDAGTTVSWSSAQMVTDVQSWLDLPASNSGWTLIGIEDVTSTAKQLHSREGEVPADRPQLVVEYGCPDFDEDGHDNVVCGGTDCDDEEAAINPEAPEVCDDVDNDCDPATSETDACNTGGAGGAAAMGGNGGIGSAAGMGGTTDDSTDAARGGGCSVADQSTAGSALWVILLALGVLVITRSRGLLALYARILSYPFPRNSRSSPVSRVS